MALDLRPQLVRIPAVAGDDIVLTLNVVDANGDPYVWTGAEFTAPISASGTGVDSGLDWTVEPGVAGLLTMSIDETDSATLGAGNFRSYLRIDQGGLTRTWFSIYLPLEDATAGRGGSSQPVELTLEVTDGSISITVSSDASASVAADLVTETAARIAADTTLTTNVATNATAIASEATARANADTALTTSLESEATARAAADTTLTTNVAANAAAITAEATTRATADTTNATAIAAEATTRAAAIAAAAAAAAALVDDLSGVTNAAVARTNIIAERKRVFNVRDYGAVGDSTTDDWAAIQAVLDAMNPGDTIVFPPTQTAAATKYMVSKPLQYPGDITIDGGIYGKANATYSGVSIAIRSGATAADWKKRGILTSKVYATGTNPTLADGPVIIRNVRLDGASRGVGNALVMMNKQCLVENYHMLGFTGNTTWNTAAGSGAGDGHGYGIVLSGYFYDGTDGSLAGAAVDCRFYTGQIQSQKSRFYTTEPTGGFYSDCTIRDLNLMIQPGTATADDDVDVDGGGGWIFDRLHSNGSGRHTIRVRSAMNTQIINGNFDGWGVSNTITGLSSATQSAIRVDALVNGGGESSLIIANNLFRWRDEQDLNASPAVGTFMAAWVESDNSGTNSKMTFNGNVGFVQTGATGTRRLLRLRGDVASGAILTAVIDGNNFSTVIDATTVFESSFTSGDGLNTVVREEGNSWQWATTAPASGNQPLAAKVWNSAPAADVAMGWVCTVAGAPGTWRTIAMLTTYGTIATQAAGAVAITGGTISGITAITIADGGTGASTAAAARLNLELHDWTLPTGYVAENVRRTAHQADLAMLSTGRATLVAFEFEAGQVVTTVEFLSGATALTITTGNQWVALCNSSRVQLAISNDKGSTAWAANSYSAFTFGTPFTIVTSGFYYFAINVTATVPPSLRGGTIQTVTSAKAPILCGSSDTGLTTPGSSPATFAALTALAGFPAILVS